jgi:hypothetical protein
MATKDYTIKVIDSEGRRLSLSINGDSVDELIRVYGDSEEYAREQVENNAVENAIHRGEIGSEVYYDDSLV